MEKLTRQEDNMMQLIWRCGGGFVKDFLEKLPAKQKALPYTTAASIVKNLEKKGFVAGQKMGNSIFYNPIISLLQYRKQTFKELFQNYFGGSYKDLVAAFIQEEHLSPEELKKIIDLIEKEK